MQKRYLKIILLIIIGLLILYFSTRNAVLRNVLGKVQLKSESSLGIKITYREAGFAGFKTFYLRGLEVSAQSGESIFKIDSVVINPKILPLLTGKRRLRELGVYNASIQLNSKLLQLIQSRNNDADSSLQEKQRNYVQTINSLQNKIFTYIPSRIIIRNSGLVLKNDSIFSMLNCENFSYEGDSFLGELVFSDKQKKSHCMITGWLDKGDHKLSATLSHTDTSTVNIPFLEPVWQTMLSFDTLKFSMTFNEISKTQTDITGFAIANDLAIKHKRIGPDVVMAKNSGFDFTFHIGDKNIELDSASNITINKFSFSPYFRFEHNATRSLAFYFIRKEFEAQELFESLPSGLFSNFKGIKTSGRLAYHLKIGIDLDRTDSVIFESQLENKGFRIDKYGVTDFRMLNGPFIQDIYEKDRYITSILVGSDNNDFVPLDQISPFLKYSILTSEDGDFFYHKGFNERAFRESIAINLKEKRFVRGGSTISMQLIKNVFLSRNKTVSRKVEEALIVWMIENLHLVSKERMFEVYLNIIELGPGVYGIKPASMFYFKKSPANLNLTESIYLSSIVPRPKGFRYTFDDKGELRDYFTSYFKLLSGIMVRRNQIPPTDTINLKPRLKLTGEARKFLAKPDSIAKEDSLFFKELVPGNTLINIEE